MMCCFITITIKYNFLHRKCQIDCNLSSNAWILKASNKNCIYLESFSLPPRHDTFPFMSCMLADVRLKYLSKASTSTSNIAQLFWKQIQTCNLNKETTWCGDCEFNNLKLALSGGWQKSNSILQYNKERIIRKENNIRFNVYHKKCIKWKTQCQLIESHHVFVTQNHRRPQMSPYFL